MCTLAQHPTAVSGFLEALLAEVRPLAAAQMAALQRIRSQEACSSAPIQAWDLPYYLNLAMVTSAPPACGFDAQQRLWCCVHDAVRTASGLDSLIEHWRCWLAEPGTFK